MKDGGANPESMEAIAYRLRLTRLALGLSQAEFCRRTGIATNTWNQYEKARSRISLDEAEKLWDTHRITLDWIFHGLIGLMPSKLADDIRELQLGDEAGRSKPPKSA